MKRWAMLLCGLAAFAAILFAAFFAWAHHTYTVGMDLNLKALAVAGVALLVAVAVVFATRRLMRGR